MKLGVALAALLVLAGCSWTTAEDESGTGIPPIGVADSNEESSTPAADAGDVADEAMESVAEDEAQEIDTEPVERVAQNQGVVEASNWLARTAMDSGSVELVWAPVDGAKTYRLYRLPTAEADYDAIATGSLAGADEVFEGNEYGYIDRDVPENTFLTYFVVAELDDAMTEPRWTEALTVDDITPPRNITGLTAEVTAEGVVLQWDPSSDDVEFAAYNVQVFVDGQLQHLGGGADPGQTSFLDNDPLDGINRYVVTAVDFHNNASAPAEIEVDVR